MRGEKKRRLLQSCLADPFLFFFFFLLYVDSILCCFFFFALNRTKVFLFLFFFSQKILSSGFNSKDSLLSLCLSCVVARERGEVQGRNEGGKEKTHSLLHLYRFLVGFCSHALVAFNNGLFFVCRASLPTKSHCKQTKNQSRAIRTWSGASGELIVCDILTQAPNASEKQMRVFCCYYCCCFYEAHRKLAATCCFTSLFSHFFRRRPLSLICYFNDNDHHQCNGKNEAAAQLEGLHLLFYGKVFFFWFKTCAREGKQK